MPEKRWPTAACLMVVVEQVKQGGLTDAYLTWKTTYNQAQCVSTTEVVAAAVQDLKEIFLFATAVDSMYTSCLVLLMDASKLTVGTVRRSQFFD